MPLLYTVLILLIAVTLFLFGGWLRVAISLLALIVLFLLNRLEKLEKIVREFKSTENLTGAMAGKSVAERTGEVPSLSGLAEPIPAENRTLSAESGKKAARPDDIVLPAKENLTPEKIQKSSRKPDPEVPFISLPPVMSTLMAKIWDWLRNGNPVVKVGIVILLFGVSFLLRYAVSRDILSAELRIALAGLLGIILLCIGWRLRIKRRTFALLMQGGGIAILYLTTFAAAKPETFFLGLGKISPEWGLAIMTALVVFSAILAVLQDALWVAIFGWAGGFMAPILLSTGENRYIALFSYYAILNAGLLGVAWFKNWRFLNLMGFFFTFGIGSLWGIQYYEPPFFSTTEPFLILFFIMYAIVSILFAKSGADGKDETRLDSMLVFGLPLIAFGLQMSLVHDMEMMGAYSCLVLSAWYLGTAKFLWKKEKTMGILAESHIGLGLIFLSLAVPMAFDATATASTWALEGAGMVWLGMRQKRISSRAFGILLQLGAAASFFLVLKGSYGDVPELGQLLAGLFLGLGGFISGWAYRAYSGKEKTGENEKNMDLVCGIWGLLFWYLVWTDWLPRQETLYTNALLLAVFTFSHLAWIAIHRKITWSIPRFATQGFIVLLFIMAPAWPEHPGAHGGWIVWPFALCVHFAVLFFHEKKWDLSLAGFLHTGSLLLVAFLFMREAWWLTNHFIPTGIWAHTAPALMGGILLLLAGSGQKLLPWPLQVHKEAYMRAGSALAIFLVFWWIAACFWAGGQEPLPYLPVLNILDLAQALIIVLIASWALKAEEIQLFHIQKLRRFFTPALTAAIFLWLNVVITRIAHFWGGILYDGTAIFQSEGLQATYSVLWTFMALLAMFYSHRRMRRKLWFVGAGLLAVVVAKLFIVDLAGRGTISGISSFIGVGILMLVVGYFFPLPPKMNQETLKKHPGAQRDSLP